jgi:hypothetical protein
VGSAVPEGELREEGEFGLLDKVNVQRARGMHQLDAAARPGAQRVAPESARLELGGRSGGGEHLGAPPLPPRLPYKECLIERAVGERVFKGQ